MTRQLKQLRPVQIAEEMARCPRVWLPLGTIEHHSHHLPVALDGLQAQGLCLDAADLAGGWSMHRCGGELAAVMAPIRGRS